MKVEALIEEIWTTYDADGSGELDKEETKEFIINVMGKMGGSFKLKDAEFEKVF